MPKTFIKVPFHLQNLFYKYFLLFKLITVYVLLDNLFPNYSKNDSSSQLSPALPNSGYSNPSETDRSIQSVHPRLEVVMIMLEMCSVVTFPLYLTFQRIRVGGIRWAVEGGPAQAGGGCRGRGSAAGQRQAGGNFRRAHGSLAGSAPLLAQASQAQET